MTDDFEVKGLKELDEKLDGLAADMQWKILKSAGMNATKPLLDEVKATTPRATDDKAIAAREKKGRKPLHEVMRRWSESGEKGEDDIGWIHVGHRSKKHWWAVMLEEGTDKIAPRGWMRRAMDNNVNTILKRLTIALQKRIAKFEKTGK